MASTSSIVIIALIVGVIVLGGLWAWSRRAVTTDKPSAKLGDEPPVKPSPLVSSPPIIATKPVEKRAPVLTPAPKAKVPKAKVPAVKKAVAPKPAAKKVTAPKLASPKLPAPKPAPVKKAAPKAAAAKPAIVPKPVPALLTIGVPAAVGKPDNLLQIKGVGPKLNTLLVGLGVTRFDQIGAWKAADAAKVDDHLGTFKGRIERDSWIEQAGLLAKGSIAEFEAKFGKLDSENK